MKNEARVHLNLQKLAGLKVDYLTTFRKGRESQNKKDHLKPIDWS
jgi:hypothetical protein